MDSMLYSFPDNYKVEHFSHALGKLGVPFMIDPKRNRTDVIVRDHKLHRRDISFLADVHGCTSQREPGLPGDPLTFLIDRDGVLWKGPTNPEDNMHWSYFDGYMEVAPYDPIWILSRSSAPEYAMEVAYDFAIEYALLKWRKPSRFLP